MIIVCQLFHHSLCNRLEMIKSITFGLLFTVFFMQQHFSMGQNLKLIGKVEDNTAPLAFVSIWIKNTTIGTVSNTEGRFKLVVPNKYSKHLICFSSLGYKTREVTIESLQNTIFLEKTDFTLPEVSVMPDDSMHRLIQEIIIKIPENYISTSTRQKGFYRTMLQADTGYQYFGEAILDIYRPSYRYKEMGNVKILNSRITRTSNNSSMPQLYFIGGIHLPFLADFIQQRKDFFDLTKIKDYAYLVEQTIKQDSSIILKISFAPKFNSKGQFKGCFYVNAKTIAVTELNISYSKTGREKRSKSLNSNLESESGSYRINYSPIGNQYYLKHILYIEKLKDQKTGKIYTKTNEYLTTEVDVSKATPIPLQEQEMLSTIFSVKAIPSAKSSWDDYNILAKETLQLAYTEEEAKKILDKKTTVFFISNKEKLIKLLSHTQSLLFLNTQPTRSQNELTTLTYTASLKNSFQIEDPVSQIDNQMNFGISLGYSLTNRISVFATQESSVNRNKWESISFGASYNFALKSYGRKLLLTPEIAITRSQYGSLMGEFNTNEPFRANGAKFNSQKIKLYAGEKAFILQLGFTLRKDISRNIKLFGGINYNLSLSSEKGIFVHESSGFSLLRRKTFVAADDPKISYKTIWPDISKTKSINVKIGIILGK